MGLTCIPMLARYLRTTEEVEKTIDGWRMSSEDANRLRFVHANKDGYFTAVQLKRVMFMRVAPRDHVMDLLTLQEHPVMREELRTWDIPKLPVNGKDLLDLGVKQGPEMGELLMELMKQFASDDYQTTKQELLDVTAQFMETTDA